MKTLAVVVAFIGSPHGLAVYSDPVADCGAEIARMAAILDGVAVARYVCHYTSAPVASPRPEARPK